MNAVKKLNTQYSTFSAPRTANTRRNLALVHPVAQLALSLLLCEHRAKVREVIRRSKATLYSVEEDMASSKAFAGLNFREWDKRREKVAAECAFILKADISRFFYTAYTHSLPWAVLGKAKAKDWWASQQKKLKSHWSNKLDDALQACQSRETFGIPVGPDTSRIIAELLLAGVEKDAKFLSAVKGRPACRLMDDFVIGFDDEDSARAGLISLRHALWAFNLQLNDEKTGVQSSKHSFKERWRLDFDSSPLVDADTLSQERHLTRLLDVTLYCCTEADSGRPAAWACNRIGKLTKIQRNFSLALDVLFRLSREYPVCVSHVAEFLINHQVRCATPDFRSRISKWAKATIKTHLPQGHDFEVSWALLVCGALQIKVSNDDMISAAGTPSPVIFAILGMLSERGLLEFSLKNWPWRADFKRAGITSDNWLPFYEAVRRKWTSDKAMVNAVKGHPILSAMLAADVTFLEDQIFDVAEINIARRVFRKRKGVVAGKSNNTAEQRVPKLSRPEPSIFPFKRFMRAEFDY